MLAKSAAWVSATGAVWATVAPSWRKNWSRPVFGLARSVATGSRLLKKGLKAAIASLSDWPRPANASPKPAVAVRAFSRVGVSKVEKMSSSSRLSVDCLRASVEPASISLLLLPGTISTNLRPRAERGRTLTVLSVASGEAVLSIFSESTAIDCCSPRTSTTCGWMSSTTPTRKPPMRTSLPATSLAPVGICALMS
jgi:hypothetical protein